VVSLGVVSGVFGFGLGDCIRYYIGVLIPCTIEACGVRYGVSLSQQFQLTPRRMYLR